MDNSLIQIKLEVFDKCKLEITDFNEEPESKEYAACRFKINGLIVISRNAKTTPKKVGQFVTFWKRNNNGPIEPYNETDSFDFYSVTVKTKSNLGQFVFPKSVLIKKGILSTSTKEGKRGFRVYPNWDVTQSNQAERTQKWQLDYFYEINEKTNFNKVIEFYKEK